MDAYTIIEILSSWNFWKTDMDVGIFRESCLDELKRLAKTEQIVAITGVRRSGKSTLMRQFIKKEIASGKDPKSFLYVNFEEPKFSGMLSLEFLQNLYDSYLDIVNPSERPSIFFDEVQNVVGWEKFVRGLHEKKEANIFVSGSNSRLLSDEFGTLLTGRWLEYKTYPLSFKEFLQFKGVVLDNKLDVISKKRDIRRYLNEYLEFGGFPLVVLNDEKEEILRRYYYDIIEKDIAVRHKILAIEKLKTLVHYYMTNFSSPIAYRKISGFIGLSLDSVERFSSYMANAYLVFFVSKFSYSLKEQEQNPRVVYGIDSGLINISGFRFSENIGKLYENLVFLQLLRNKKEIYYNKGKKECDFLIMDRQKVSVAIQVCSDLNNDNRERELNGLTEAMDTFGLDQGIMITDDEVHEDTVAGKKIIYMPLWKWLLQ